MTASDVELHTDVISANNETCISAWMRQSGWCFVQAVAARG